ncbi:MAG: hypothetical protein NTX64_00110 [Elusimicrobia bacterium]|nr:hypothetical protein [Elusimicrobiota bacterium]
MVLLVFAASAAALIALVTLKQVAPAPAVEAPAALTLPIPAAVVPAPEVLAPYAPESPAPIADGLVAFEPRAAVEPPAAPAQKQEPAAVAPTPVVAMAPAPEPVPQPRPRAVFKTMPSLSGFLDRPEKPWMIAYAARRPANDDKSQIVPCDWRVQRRGQLCINSMGTVTTQDESMKCSEWGAQDCKRASKVLQGADPAETIPAYYRGARVRPARVAPAAPTADEQGSASFGLN